MPTNKKFRNGTKRKVENESKNNLANKKKHGFGKGKQNRNQKQQGADGKNTGQSLLFATNPTIKLTNGDSIAPIPHGLEKVEAR